MLRSIHRLPIIDWCIFYTGFVYKIRIFSSTNTIELHKDKILSKIYYIIWFCLQVNTLKCKNDIHSRLYYILQSGFPTNFIAYNFHLKNKKKPSSFIFRIIITYLYDIKYYRPTRDVRNASGIYFLHFQSIYYLFSSKSRISSEIIIIIKLITMAQPSQGGEGVRNGNDTCHGGPIFGKESVTLRRSILYEKNNNNNKTLIY